MAWNNASGGARFICENDVKTDRAHFGGERDALGELDLWLRDCSANKRLLICWVKALDVTRRSISGRWVEEEMERKRWASEKKSLSICSPLNRLIIIAPVKLAEPWEESSPKRIADGQSKATTSSSCRPAARSEGPPETKARSSDTTGPTSEGPAKINTRASSQRVPGVKL